MSNARVLRMERDHSNDTIAFTRLGEAMRNGIDPPAQLIPDLLYQQGIHSIYSPGGTGKTIMALWCALRAITQGLHVIYCDEENGSVAVAELLQCYGADPEEVDNYLHYAEFPGLVSGQAEVWTRTINTIRPALVVFDSFADMLALEGLDENSSVHITAWMKRLAEPVKRLNGAVLLLDHINKADSGSGARGSTAKLASVDVAWRLKGKQFDRQTTAEIILTRDKDRKGCMPKARKFTVGGNGQGELIFDAGEVEEEPSDEPDPDALMGNRKVAFNILKENFPNGAKYNQWMKACTEPDSMSESTFNRVRDELRRDKYVTLDDARNLYFVAEGEMFS